MKSAWSAELACIARDTERVAAWSLRMAVGQILLFEF